MSAIKRIIGTKITLLSMVFLAYAAPSQASSIAITNSGFEDPVQGPGGIGNGAATGWAVSNVDAGVWFPITGQFFNTAAPEGNQVLFVGFVGAAADVNQTPLAATVQADTTYTLSFLLGRRLDLELSTYSVSLEANGVVLGSDSAGSPTAGNFIPRTITFNSGASPATLGQQLGIFIHASGLSATGSGAQAEFDAFSLDSSSAGAAAVPEPTTFVLIGAGISLIMLSRRRSKHAA